MKTNKIDAYKANARDNAAKTRNAAEIAVGDFLYLVTGYGKENGLRDYIRTHLRREKGRQKRNKQTKTNTK